MLYHFLAFVRKNKIFQAVNTFLYSPWYALFIALSMAFSNLFAEEFTIFYFYVSLGLYVALFAPDGFPILPMFCCGYMLFSAGNNPNSHYGETFLSTPEAKASFITVAGAAAIVLLTRLFVDLFLIRRKNPTPKLSLGFLALGVAYILGGSFSGYYDARTAFFGALEIIALCFTYFYFYFTVDWSKRSPADAAALLTAVGVGLAVEIVGMYCTPAVREAVRAKTFTRGMLVTGWGGYNNIGGMMVMLMPAPLYFACTKKRGWLYALLSSLFLGAVVLSQSRGAIVTGAAVYAVGSVFVLLHTKKRARIQNLCVFAATVIVALVAFILLKRAQAQGNVNLFTSLLRNGLQSAGRIQIYKFGWEQFQNAPFFGNGFYANLRGNVYIFAQEKLPDDYFLPPRYHNTAIQLLASGGLFAAACYLLHRGQALALFLRRPAPHKTFLGLGILALLISSLVDCHFFNLGPGLTYGMLLVCAERLPHTKRTDPTLFID